VTRDPHHRGLRPHPEALGVTLLEAGEGSRPLRARASLTVLDWAQGLRSEGLGAVLTEAYITHMRERAAAAQQDLEAAEQLRRQA